MKKSILKSVSISLAAAIFFIGCSFHEAHAPKKSGGKHAKDLKKKRMKKVGTEKKADLTKFCFKDNRSIHYKSSQRCK